MKTRAAVCRAFGAPLTIETVRPRRPGPGEVQIKTAACAICHSDIFYMDGAWGGELPAVYGHEAAGVVEAVGPGVTRLKPGDHVVATLIRNCGFCQACAEGAPVFCEEVFPLDQASRRCSDEGGKPIVHGLRTGAFAERIVVDASQAVAIPKDMKLDSASLIACGVLTGIGRGRQHRQCQGGLERRRDRLRRRRPQLHPGRTAGGVLADHRRRRRTRQARGGARIRRDRRRSTPGARTWPRASRSSPGGGRPTGSSSPSASRERPNRASR